MTEPLTLAVVGCGAVAGWHVDALAERRDVRITATVDVDADRAQALAARTGARAFTSLADALAAGAGDGGFAAAAVLVPPRLHEPVTVTLLEAGRHVLLEKPMANTVEECERILAVAGRVGTVFMVAENAQYWPEVVLARELLAKGAVGQPVTARACAALPPLPEFYVPGGWRFDAAAAGGGITLDTGSHWLRPLRMLMGEIDEVAAGIGHPFAPMEGESLVRAVVRFRSGLLGSFDAYVVTGPWAFEPAFRVTGSDGELTIDALGSLRLHDAGTPGGRELGGGVGYMASYGAEHGDFLDAVIKGTPLAAGPVEAVAELRIAQAMVRAAGTKQWEPVW